LSLRVNVIPEDKRLDLFIGTLKENIQHEVSLLEPTSLEKDFMLARKVESKNMASKGPLLTPIEKIISFFLHPLNLQG